MAKVLYNQSNINSDLPSSAGTELPWGWQAYFDRDFNTSTGFAVNGIGAEYLLQGGQVLRYIGGGSDWNWELVGSADAVRYHLSTAELVVKRSLLGNPAFMRVVFVGRNAAVGGTETDYYPNTGSFSYNFRGNFDSNIASLNLINELTDTFVTVDGVLDDWAGFTYFHEDTNEQSMAIGNQVDWHKSSIAHSTDKVYLAYKNRHNMSPTQEQGSSLSWGWQAYFDTDKRSDSGFKIGNIGADYILQGGSISRYTGNGYNWSLEYEGEATELAFNGHVAEIAFDKTLIGSPSGMNVIFAGRNAAFGGGYTDLYPDTGSFLYRFSSSTGNTPVATRSNLISSQITFNDVLKSWAGYSSYPDDTGDFGERYPDGEINWRSSTLTHDTNNLYVRYQNLSRINPQGDTEGNWLSWGYQTYLDTDKKSSTGFKVGQIGADYILQGGVIQRYTGTGYNWSWQTTGYANDIVYSWSSSDMSIPRDLIGNPASMNIIHYGRSAASGGSVDDRYPNAGYFRYEF